MTETEMVDQADSKDKEEDATAPGEEPKEAEEQDKLLGQEDDKEQGASGANAEVKYSSSQDAAEIAQENGQEEEGEPPEKRGRDGSSGGGSSFASAAHNIKRILSPIMFEGESDHSLLRPKFHNPLLEVQYKLSYFRAELFRFRAALVYLALYLVAYILYFAISSQGGGPISITMAALFLLILIAFFVITFLPIYNSSNFHFYHYAFAILLLTMPLFTLASLESEVLNSVYIDGPAYPVSSLSAIFIIFIILYAVASIPVMIVFSAGILYSFSFELFYFFLYAPEKGEPKASPMLFFTRMLLHVCLHILGVHFSHYYSSRKRELFNKKGRAILANEEIERETVEMKNLIYSVMPKVVAEQMMAKEDSSEKPMKVFRDLYVEVLDNVSILFADIVGFTNMSSGKTAEELLDLLNDLYGRFDRLAEETGCEKIATLGDCYYCVSGCPEERADHAKCAINMGLAMIQAIKQFDEDRHQTVQMRVGVHTGKVICGVVGVRRHKFDILSDDVFIANDMESSGEPSAVHISEYTRIALEENGDDKDLFVLKEFKPDEEKSSKLSRKQYKKTYLVSKKFGTDEQNAALGTPSKKPKDSSANLQEAESKTAPNETPSSPTSPTVAIVSGATTGESSTDDKVQNEGQEQASEQRRSSGAEVIEDVEQKSSEEQLIDLLQQKETSIHIFTDTPINLATLWFKGSLETEYKLFFREKIMDEVSHENLKCTAFIYDLLPTVILYTLVAFCLILSSIVHDQPLALSFHLILTVFSILVFLILLFHLIFVSNEKYRASLSPIVSGWIPCHVSGLTMLFAPIGLLIAYATCAYEMSPYVCYISILLWIHFANYPRLSTVVKVLILILTSVLIALPLNIDGLCCSSNSTKTVQVNGTTMDVEIPVSIFSGTHPIRIEMILQYGLLCLFVWMLSVDFETMIRANFHADIQERDRKTEMVRMNEKTQTKLQNIMPAYVVDHFNETNTRTYSASRQNVGIIFFFVDFWASYSEDYKSGAEYIRLLNELVSDFDALLDKEEYKYVEKIKTISSTYMAASNLNPAYNDDWKIQLSALMKFMLELKQKLIEFCQDIPGQATYISKGGINFGPVTAGVIGSSKLHFDIWGDAVNVASRMYSTGDSNMLQMTERTKDALIEAGDWDKEKFVYRKKVFVKGKGDMETYYFKH